MGILDKIKDIEAEMNRTQKNKATEHHIGLMKARLAKLRAQVPCSHINSEINLTIF